MHSLFYFVFYLAVWRVADGLEIHSSLEGSCTDMPTTPASNVDMDWLRSIRKWNFLGGNKFMLYMASQIISGGDKQQIDALPDDELVSDGCFQMDTKKGMWTLSGLEPRQKGQLNVTEIGPGILDAVPYSPDSHQAGQGTARHYITLTDNSTFFLFHMCFLGLDQKAWGLFSTKDKLDDKTMNMVNRHLNSNGFDQKYFTFLKFDDCLKQE